MSEVFVNSMLPVLTPMSDPPSNSIGDMAERAGGCILSVEAELNGNNETVVANIFKIHGTVEVIDAYGEITDATTLTNMTGVYFDVYDGTVAVEVTDSAGAVLSGAPVGTMILRTGITSEVATVVFADQVRLTESDTSKKTHQPFTVTQKNGIDTFLRIHYATTDAPMNAKVNFYVTYASKDGGYMEVVS